MRRVGATTWVCTGCNQVIHVPDARRPVEVELRSDGQPPVRVIAVDGKQVHRCSPAPEAC